MVWAILALAFTGLGFAGTAVALGLRVGSIRGERDHHLAKRVKAEGERDESESERDITRDQFARYQAKTEQLLEKQRDDLTYYADLFATCNDSSVILGHLDRMLQEAAGGAGDISDESSDYLFDDSGAKAGDEISAR